MRGTLYPPSTSCRGKDELFSRSARCARCLRRVRLVASASLAAVFSLRSERSLPQELADATGVLLSEAAGVHIRTGLGPHVGQRFLRIGHRERPVLAVANLHPVDQLL